MTMTTRAKEKIIANALGVVAAAGVVVIAALLGHACTKSRADVDADEKADEIHCEAQCIRADMERQSWSPPPERRCVCVPKARR